MTREDGGTYDLFSLVCRDRTDLTSRRNNFCALDNLWTAIFVQHRDEPLADRKLSKHRLNFYLWILAEGFCRRFDRFLIARGKCPQRMLHAIPKLPKHNVWDIERILANEINANAFGANQSHHLFDLLFDRRRDVGKEQVRFIEKENELRFLRVANFWKILEQFRKHPEQKCRVNLRRFLHQLVRSQDVDHSFAALCLDQVIEIECGFAEKFVCAL